MATIEVTKTVQIGALFINRENIKESELVLLADNFLVFAKSEACESRGLEINQYRCFGDGVLILIEGNIGNVSDKILEIFADTTFDKELDKIPCSYYQRVYKIANFIPDSQFEELINKEYHCFCSLNSNLTSVFTN